MSMLFQAVHKAEHTMFTFTDPFSCTVFHCFERLLISSESLLDQSRLPRKTISHCLLGSGWVISASLALLFFTKQVVLYSIITPTTAHI